MGQNPNQNKFLKVALMNWGFSGDSDGRVFRSVGDWVLSWVEKISLKKGMAAIPAILA